MLAGIAGITGAASKTLSIYDLINDLGISSNLVCCIDAGDSRSYSGGQSVTDLSPIGSTFYLGSGSSSDGADPTFDGSVGGLSSSEGFRDTATPTASAVGDYLSLVGDPSWNNSLHHTGDISIVAAVYLPSLSNNTDLFSNIHETEYGGVYAWFSPVTQQFLVNIEVDEHIYGHGITGAELTVPGWNIISMGLSWPGRDYTVGINGTINSATLSDATNLLSNNPTNNMRLMARSYTPSEVTGTQGFKVGHLSIWKNRNLTAEEQTAIFEGQRGRYGL